MMRLAIGFVLLFLAFPTHHLAAQDRTSTAVRPGVRTNISYQYYTVEGTAVSEIAESLQANGPRSDKALFYATTTSQTGFSYRRVERGAYCKLENVGVQTDVVMLLPQWVEREDSPERLRRAWDEFLDNLITHEGEHYRIVDESTTRLYQALTGMRADDCAMLDSQAKATIEEISGQQTELNLRFDRETGHGKDDGAVWPPQRYYENP
ncbi:MAG: DUF922 domain-containing Zn-dependent protease [Rhodothermia bacterium]|nr:DUF922 domain-containing Zn-dependent protease [Rhodothermia bacterium]